MAIKRNGNTVLLLVNNIIVDTARVEGKWIISNTTNEVVGKNW